MPPAQAKNFPKKIIQKTMQITRFFRYTPPKPVHEIFMRLTTKGHYAVTAMIDLAMHQPGAPVTLKSIAENQGISLPYLEQLFAMLRRGNLVRGTRGPGGGYVLARGADRISMAEIVTAVREPLDITRCDGRQDCRRGRRCLSHDLWSALGDELYGFLDGIRLGELMRRSGLKPAARRRAVRVQSPRPRARVLPQRNHRESSRA